MKEEIIEKIRKCFALSKSSNENEAFLANQKAIELLEKYNLTMVDIEVFEEKSNVTSDTIIDSSKVEVWLSVFANRLSKVYDCEIIRFGSTLKIFGFPVDIAVFNDSFNYLSSVILKLYKKNLVKEKKLSAYWDRKKTYSFKKGFCFGCSNRLVERIQEDRDSRLNTNSNSLSLVLVKKESVKNYISEKFTNLRTKKTKMSYFGYDKGYNAGNSININNRNMITN